MSFRQGLYKGSTTSCGANLPRPARPGICSLLVIATLGVWAGRAEAATYCAFPGTSADSYSTYCGRIDWPINGWQNADRLYTEVTGDPNTSQADIVGDATYPAMMVQKMWDTKLRRYYLYFRLRVNYQGTVTASTQAPFKYGDNNSSTYYWMLTKPSASPMPLYAVAWDVRAGSETAHGLEMTYRKAAAPTLWEGFYFEDVDDTQTGKCDYDIDGSGVAPGGCVFAPEKNDGFVRLIESQTGPTGATPNTFIEMAVSCDYFAGVQAKFANQRGAFNPCTESFLSSAAIAYTKADNQSLGATYTDIYGIPAFDSTTTIATDVWGPAYNPTAAVVTDFGSRSAGNGVEVAWQTASEVGTAGFHLHRIDPVTGARIRVNRHLVAALEGSPNGGRYLVLDPGAPLLGESTYVVEEIEHDGTSRTYGPFTVRPESASPGHAPSKVGASGWSRAHRSDDAGAARVVRSVMDDDQFRSYAPPTRKPSGRRSASRTGQAGAAARVVVTTEGLQALDSATIASSLGMTEAATRAAIRARKLSIVGPEGPVACQPSGDGARLYFHGKLLRSTWSDTATYRLTRGECREFGRVEGRRLRGDPPDTAVFVDQAHVEQDRFPMTALFHQPWEDFWLWTQLVGSHPTLGAATYPLPIQGATGGGGTITVNVQGETSSGMGRDHHVRLTLNGTLLGDTAWEGAAPASAAFTVPPGVIATGGGNELRLEALVDEGVPYSIIGLDSFDVSWQRGARAIDDQLRMPRGLSGDIVIDGFTGSDIWILDLGEPGDPRRLGGTQSGIRQGSGFVRFAPSSTGGPFLAIRPAAAAVPALEIVPDRPSLRHAGITGADYLVLTSEDLAPAARRLADLRSARGLRSLVVTVEQIYDEYNLGNRDPAAIHAFLTDVHRTWRRVPRFLVLAGSGTYDGRGVLGVDDDHVPPQLIVGAKGLSPSDVALADVEGDDGVPEFAVGRIPASTQAELVAYVEKLKAYELESGSWRTRALFLADDPDQGGDFPADSTLSFAALGGGVAGRQLNHVADKNATRSELLRALNDGVGIFHYFGHAAADRLGNEGLLTTADVDAMTNGARAPVALLMTCSAGLYGYPGYDSIAVRLTKQAGGGAIAAVAPSSLEWESDSRVLSQGMLSALSSGTGSVGEAFVFGLAASRDAGTPIEMRRTYTLFGDPAVRLWP